MSFLDFIPGGGWIKLAVVGVALAAIGALVGGFIHHERDIGRQEVQASWDAERAAQVAAALKQSAEYRAIETARVARQAEAEKRKNDEISNLDRKLAVAVDQLRKRPERPAPASGAPSNPQPAQACTGAELYRPDAEFLVREAARAERIRVERDALWEKYDALTVKP